MRIIKKLDWFIVKQFMGLLVGAFVICQFVLMMQFLWKYIDALIGKGIPMDVLAQFFWYMGLMLVPQALPLSILLASLITFGNLGESVELTAIKSAGISLMQAFRPLIVVALIIMGVSFYFQNVIGPNANLSFSQLLLSMKQKSPELEIPEGVFYDGIPGSNVYVQKKDLQRAMLYGLMIYRMTDSFEDAAIILADSGKIQATADKKHLLLSLYSGEWFENMQRSGLGDQATIPYRRETFTEKKILIEYNSDFDLAETAGIANDARSKGLNKIVHDMDSVNCQFDSIGRSFLTDEIRMVKMIHIVDTCLSKKEQKKKLLAWANAKKVKQKSPDSLFVKLTEQKKLLVTQEALSEARRGEMEAEYKGLVTDEGDHFIVMHELEIFSKFTMSFACMIFFFIGAPLGAVIRKGGLGVPVLISVIVFIIYIILDTSGYRMARGHFWAVWFGKLLPTAVLMPFAIFVTYRANKDLTVFNKDIFIRFWAKNKKVLKILKYDKAKHNRRGDS
ncbi:MAG: LptF/LptG family permease [Bacteroidaceae bacterium]|nr:LptF/LptG family permease [Bacteroidaceae bacterium]